MNKAKTFIGALILGLSGGLWAAGPVDINTASAESLADAIKGVGLTKAQAIVEFRDSNGPFTHINELTNVKGIGAKIVDDSRDNLTISPSVD